MEYRSSLGDQPSRGFCAAGMIDRSDSLNLAFTAENSRYSAETETGRSGGSFDGFYEHGSLALITLIHWRPQICDIGSASQ